MANQKRSRAVMVMGKEKKRMGLWVVRKSITERLNWGLTWLVREMRIMKKPFRKIRDQKGRAR